MVGLIAVGHIYKVHVGIGERETVGIGLAVAGIGAQGDVASHGAEPAVVLQHAFHVFRLAIADAVRRLQVDESSSLLQQTLACARILQSQLGTCCVLKRVVGDLVRIGVKLCRQASCQCIAALDGERWTEHNIGHRVGFPFQAETSVPAVAAREVLGTAVRERRLLAHEVLGSHRAADVSIAVVPSQRGVHLELVLVLVVVVQTQHLRGVESLLVGTPSAGASTAGESHVVGVVG